MLLLLPSPSRMEQPASLSSGVGHYQYIQESFGQTLGRSSTEVRPSCSEWASPSVLVRKRDGSVRWCIDLRKLNDVTVKDCYPLPLLQDCIDALEGCRYFTTLDMASGYYQLEVAEEDRDKAAFVTKYGLFSFRRMPFGLCNAPATFSRSISLVLRGLS